MHRIALYIKQAWNILRQEKVFSSIYIIGTGLSITMVMVLSIIFYLKIANIYPETNRDRLLIVKSGLEKYKDGGMSSSSLSLKLIDDCLRPIKNVEAISVQCGNWDEASYIQLPDNKTQLPVSIRYVDTGFWNVFSFRFIDGTPFTEADFNSGLYSVVVAESIALRVFGRTDVAGEYLNVDFRPCRISGVVKNVSPVTEHTYAQLWFPYTVLSGYNQSWGKSGFLGRMQVFLLAATTEVIPQIKEDAKENIRRASLTLPDIEFSVAGQPDSQWQTIFRFWSSQEVDFNLVLILYGLIFLVLLGVPAVSLSGMIDSRMERRMSEIAVRRAFGAPNGKLMVQLLSENFLFTLLGGVAGLLFSYLILLIAKENVLTLGQQYVNVKPEGSEVVFAPEMLLNYTVFGIAFGVCVLLNFTAVFVPAWRALHREIVYSQVK